MTTEAVVEIPLKKPRGRFWRRAGFATIAAVVTYVGVGWMPTCTDLDAANDAIYAIPLVALAEGWFWRASWRGQKLLLVRVGLVLGVASSAMLLSGKSHKATFGEVFGVDVPEGVSGLQSQRLYAGLFHGDDILLRFTANEQTLQHLMAGSFARQDGDLNRFRDGQIGWEEFCYAALLHPEPKWGRWVPNRPMARPVVYQRWHEDSAEPLSFKAAVLWDETTGETYVHRFGF